MRTFVLYKKHIPFTVLRKGDNRIIVPVTVLKQVYCTFGAKNMPLEDNMKVALYIRVSTEEQVERGASVEAQTAALRAWAKKEKMTIAGEYVDAGFSARKPAAKRPELMRMLADIKAGKIQMVVFTKLDRWFRNIGEYYKVQEILEKHNTSWRAIHEDYETVTAAGRLKVNIMLAVNQDEADRDSERIHAVFNRKKELGEVLSGSVPLGYKIENKKYAIDENTADMARDMFAMLFETRSAYTVQRYMRNKYGYTRDITTLKRTLRNPIYKGEKYGIKDYCPAILTPAQHDTALEILSCRAGRHGGNPVGRIYIFRSLVKCADCGHNMIGLVCKNFYYYRCTQHVYVGDCPNSKYIREEAIEEYLVSHILQKCAAHNVQIAKASKTHTKHDEIAIRRKMSKLKDLYLSDLIEKAEYEKDYLELRDALDAVEKAKLTIHTPINIEALKDSLAVYNSFDKDEKRAFWSLILKEIVCDGNTVVSFTLRNT